MKNNGDLPTVTLSEHQGIRDLHLDSPWIQGSMRIKAPFDIELEYVQRMMVWLLFLEPQGLGERHAMQLGLGAATITKFCHKRLRMRTTAVELNPQVISACRAWFHLPPDDRRLTVIQADAAQVVREPERLQTVDALCVDLYDHEAAAPVLDDEAFYAGCRGLLVDGGVMTVNLFGRDASFARSSARVAAVFGRDQVWSMRPTKEGNTVLIGGRGVVVPDRETLQARAATIEERYGLPARKWLRMVRPLE
ncbi:spermidine synthase [Ideonella sp. BN130291]|uniref:spermidine synthase n=1 Tax=Ideonella sp. BN130291 TaxID=3112940 RepID=UPI002E2715EB|nr:spermidine synthase [Ideonella sp. BN130291]